MSYAERLLDYTYKIVEGEILACKKHIHACQRFLNDLERIGDEDFPYTFEGDELEEFVKWSSLFKHTKGVLAGKNIELTDFQLFLVANVFCWKEKESGYRRFRYIYIQLARKNAKSQLLALIASYTAFLSNEQEEVYIGGTNREQSQIVFNEILAQISVVKALRGKYKDSYGKITHIRSNSIIQPLSKEARKTGDGKNPSVAIIDEFHQHQTDEIYETMKTGMVARTQPMMVIITTAGLDLASPCYTEYQYVSKVIDPENAVINDEYFVMITELDEDDDIKDENNWIKANPIVATYEEGMKSIRGDLKLALENPEKMTKFLTKNMNLWVQAKENGYMDLKKWNECGIGKGESLPDIQGKEVYIAVDLSATLDLTSVAFLIPIGDEKFVTLGHSFMPEDTLIAKMNTDKVPYDLWERQGWLSFTEGAVVDYRYLQKYIDEQVEKYNWQVKALCYDPWQAQQFINEAMDLGYITVKVIQGMKTLSPAAKDFRELVYREKIIHDNNPVINWAMGNAVTKKDHNENFMLDKDKSSQRIDPVASIITAHAQARFHYQYGDVGNYSDEDLDKLGW
ncbi:terminase large subunit [Halobacillus andaensis]|uniref:terminase large subunit n=1 Tax=Halobacillus andaensis TaxID=1176239 RepID=UPI003D71998B